METENVKKVLIFSGVLLLLILAISALLVIFVFKVPFLVMFGWVCFITGVPLVWHRFGKGIVWKFWAGWLKRAGKTALALFLFLLIRSFFAYLVQFSVFESYIGFTETTGATAFLGYTPGKILFEALFLLLVGFTVLEAVYNHRKKAWVFIGVFLVSCFLIQTFFYSLGYKSNAVAQTAAKPLHEDRMISAVENKGVLGAAWSQGWEFLFGKKINQQPTDKIQRGRRSFESMSYGEHDFILAPGEKTAWLRLPDKCSWDLFETVIAGKWGITPYGGKTFRFEPGQSRYAYFSDQDTIIMAENFGTEPLPLKLLVEERGM